MLVYGKCECFGMQMLYVCVLCASCGSSQCCVLHDNLLMLVEDARGHHMAYSRVGLITALLVCIEMLIFTRKNFIDKSSAKKHITL